MLKCGLYQYSTLHLKSFDLRFFKALHFQTFQLTVVVCFSYPPYFDPANKVAPAKAFPQGTPPAHGCQVSILHTTTVSILHNRHHYLLFKHEPSGGPKGARSAMSFLIWSFPSSLCIVGIFSYIFQESDSKSLLLRLVGVPSAYIHMLCSPIWFSTNFVSVC